MAIWAKFRPIWIVHGVMSLLLVAMLWLFGTLLVLFPGPRSWIERDAAEVGKTYVLAVDAVLTSSTQTLPGLLRPERTVRKIMAPKFFRSLNDYSGPDFPHEGTVQKGARLKVDQAFVFSGNFNGSTRYRRGRLSDPECGEYTVYIIWEDWADINLLLKEGSGWR